MVYLAMTPQGLQDILALLLDRGDGDADVWCGADAISEAGFNKLDYPGLFISRFDYPLAGADSDTMADALGTIREHHPGKRIWVESVAVNALAAG